MSILALDPSIRSCGVALFSDTGKLFWSDCIMNQKEKFSVVKRAMNMGYFIVSKAQHRTSIQEYEINGSIRRESCEDPITNFVSEWPQIYQAVKSKGDPNGLIAMAAVVTTVATTLGLFPVTYLPYEWCGRLPKSTKGDPKQSVRGQRILSKLSIDEQRVVVSSHDAIDAIGIGLHYFNRLH